MTIFLWILATMFVFYGSVFLFFCAIWFINRKKVITIEENDEELVWLQNWHKERKSKNG